MTDNEIIEIMARAVMVAHGCGCTIDGKLEFCHDERMPADTRYRVDECGCKQAASAALAALRSAGLAIVPREPTEVMLIAGEREWTGRKLYRAMIATAEGKTE